MKQYFWWSWYNLSSYTLSNTFQNGDVDFHLVMHYTLHSPMRKTRKTRISNCNEIINYDKLNSYAEVRITIIKEKK